MQPRDGHVVIAVIDEEMNMKRLSAGPARMVLKAENPTNRPCGRPIYRSLHGRYKPDFLKMTDIRILGLQRSTVHMKNSSSAFEQPPKKPDVSRDLIWVESTDFTTSLITWI
ncbi:hypothetical protein [Glutamicibacter sp. Je.9.36]|uniref:hypothetical protein n=1 Tax=Glutamicibacter sp. Je.9.36 TaxID=3142837 RepID=UPI003DA8CE05